MGKIMRFSTAASLVVSMLVTTDFAHAQSSCDALSKKHWSASSDLYERCGGQQYMKQPEQCLSMTNDARQMATTLRDKCGVPERGQFAQNWKLLYQYYLVISDYISSRNGGESYSSDSSQCLTALSYQCGSQCFGDPLCQQQCIGFSSWQCY